MAVHAALVWPVWANSYGIHKMAKAKASTGMDNQRSHGAGAFFGDELGRALVRTAFCSGALRRLRETEFGEDGVPDVPRRLRQARLPLHFQISAFIHGCPGYF